MPILIRLFLILLIEYPLLKYILALDNFGASAPAQDIYNHFGLNSRNLETLGKKIIKENK